MMMHHLVLLVLTVTLSAAGTVKKFYRCCDHGEHYSFETGMCALLPRSVSNTDTEIPVYKGKQLQQRVSADSFSIITAPNWCNNGKNGTTRFHLEEEFYLQQDGRIFIPHDTKPYMDRNAFCITYDTDSKEYMVFGCDQEIVQEQRYNTLGMILSLPFLLVTFLVHACVPELQNLHGKCLMCYVLTLLIAYIFLVIVQLAKAVIMHEFCVTAPFIIYFAFMVSFMWLNVMCIDICVTFSGRRGYTGARLRGSEDKRFFVYSLYAWGIPLIMLIVVLILQFTPDLPASIITPRFGESKCWFPDDKSLGLFFYGPILLVILVNLGLFAYTTLKIWSIQRDTDKSMRNESQRHGDDTDKQRYKLYLKLMFVFGVNWLMEIVSWQANGPSWLWYVTDMCNALYGVLIFFIFVCKANVWKLVKKRYHVMMGRPYLASTFGPTSSTRSTGTSNLSTTDVGGVDSIALRSSANA